MKNSGDLSAENFEITWVVFEIQEIKGEEIGNSGKKKSETPNKGLPRGPI